MSPDFLARGLAARVASQSEGLAIDRGVLAALTGVQRAYLAESGRLGRFVWNSANLSTAIAADPNQGLAIAPHSDGSGASGAWERESGPLVMAEWFGCVGDDATDNRTALQQALNTLAGVYPGGFTLTAQKGKKFRVTPGIAVPAKARFEGMHFTTAGGTASDVFTVQGAITTGNALTSFYEGIGFKDCLFESDSAFNAFWVKAANVARFRFINNRLKGGGLSINHGALASGLYNVSTGSSTVDPLVVAGFSSTNADHALNEDIIISGNVVDLVTAGRNGIRVNLARKVTITGNTVFGNISWWGGSAVYDEGGNLQFLNRVRDVAITGNYVEGGNGGIYGQKGEYVQVTGNVLKNITDTAIDFEGCANCQATGNVVHNAGNYCLSTFYKAINIVFEGNLCVQDGTGANISNTLYGGAGLIGNQYGNLFLAMKTGNSNLAAGGFVRAVNNVFLYTGSNGPGQHSLGYCDMVLYERNHHIDVRANLTDNTKFAAVARENSFYFKTVPADGLARDLLFATNCSDSHHSDMSRNFIEVACAMPAGSRGIVAQHLGGNAGTGSIRSNSVILKDTGALTYGVVALLSSSNGAVTHRYDVTDNVVSSGVTYPLCDASAPGFCALYLRGNHTQRGAPVPSIETLAGFRFGLLKGSVIESDTPSQGGTFQKVVTADAFAMVSGTDLFAASTAYAVDAGFYTSAGGVYRVLAAGTSDASEPTHTSGSATNGTLTCRYVGTLPNYAASLLGGSVTAATSAANGAITPDIDSFKTFVRTGLTGNCTINAPTGTPYNGQEIVFRLTSFNTTERTLIWDAIYRYAGYDVFPATAGSELLYCVFRYNAADTKWDLVRGASVPRQQIKTTASGLTPNVDNYTSWAHTAQGGAVTINNPTGTYLFGGKRITLSIRDNGTSRSLTWGSQYRSVTGTALPSNTTINKIHSFTFEYNATDTKWDAVSITTEA